MTKDSASTNDSVSTKDSVSSTLSTSNDSTLTFVGVGDIMMGLNYPDESPVLPPEDGALIFADVKSILQDATLTIGNLEGVLLDLGGTPTLQQPQTLLRFSDARTLCESFSRCWF